MKNDLDSREESPQNKIGNSPKNALYAARLPSETFTSIRPNNQYFHLPSKSIPIKVGAFTPPNNVASPKNRTSFIFNERGTSPISRKSAKDERSPLNRHKNAQKIDEMMNEKSKSPKNTLFVQYKQMKSNSPSNGQDLSPNSNSRRRRFGKVFAFVEENTEQVDSNFDFTNIKIKFPPWVINPAGLFINIWNFCILFTMIVILFVYSIRLCFELDVDDNFSWGYSWLPFDIVIDLLCATDIVVNFLTAVTNEAGILITSKKAIANNYSKKYFITDVLGLFQINPIVFQLPHVQYGVRGFNNSYYIAWRFIRLIKLVKLRKFFHLLETCLQHLKVKFENISLIKFLVEFIMVVHFTACFWGLLGEVELRDSWIDVEQNRYDSISSKYIETLYFSFTVILTVGYGNITANNTLERSMLIILMFFGVILYAYIIGSLSRFFARTRRHQITKK